MNKVTIQVHNINSKIVEYLGPEIQQELKKALSYIISGSQFSTFAQLGWDGTKNLLNTRNNTFPTGLLKKARTTLNSLGIEVELKDLREKPTGFPIILKNVKLRDYQEECVKEMCRVGRGLIQVGTSGGKCFRFGTEVLMYDGTKRKIETLQPGEQVMGIDSKPRTVQEIHTGKEQLYKVQLKKGATYYVTGNHILTGTITGLSNTRDKYVRDCYGNKHYTGDIVDISVLDWFRSSKTFKHTFKMFYKGVSDFNNSKDLPLDPYALGLWLSDGTARCMSITTMEKEVRDYWYSLLKEGQHMTTSTQIRGNKVNKATTYTIAVPRGSGSNSYIDILRKLGVLNNKHIPDMYKLSSFENRASLLAGILDADGYNHNGCHEIIQKTEKLANDIEFLARSLGFYVSKNIKKAKCQTGFSGLYYRLNICGDFSKIPFKVPRRFVQEHKRFNKYHRLFGIDITPDKVDNYCGFSVKEEDKHFLLGDFLVAHNSAITAGVLANLGVNSLVIVPTKELLKQTSKGLSKFLGIKVGIIGDGEKDIGKITVATFQSLTTSKDVKKRKYDPENNRWRTVDDKEVIIRQDLKEYLDHVECVFTDESHHLAASSLQQIYDACPNAYYRFGCSATPFHDTDEDVLIEAVTGRLLKKFSASYLIAHKWISQPTIHLIPFKQDRLPVGTTYAKAYEERVIKNKDRNNLIKDIAETEADKGNSVLISVRQINHGKLLYDLLKGKYKNKVVFLNSKVASDKVTETLQKLFKKEILIVIGTSMLNEGINVPSLDALIFASCPKSPITTIQLVGRVLRRTETKTTVNVYDIQDYGCKYLTSASKERVNIYQTEPEFILKETGLTN